MNKKVFNIIIITIDVICCAILVWALASYIDVLNHNITDQNYAEWNLFEILCQKYIKNYVKSV